MHKFCLRMFPISLLMLPLVLILEQVVQADDVVVELRLDPQTTRYVLPEPCCGPAIRPIHMSLIVRNISDKPQSLRVQPSYRFDLYKTSPVVAHGRDLVGGGTLLGVRGLSFDTVPPHSEHIEAEGILPNNIDSPSPLNTTASAFPAPGAYILSVETPTGVPGLVSGTKTEAMFFAEARADRGVLQVSTEGTALRSDGTVYYGARPINVTVTYADTEEGQTLYAAGKMTVQRQEGEQFPIVFEQPLQIGGTDNSALVLFGHSATTVAVGTIPAGRLSSGTYRIIVTVSAGQQGGPTLLQTFATRIIHVRSGVLPAQIPEN